MLAYLAAGAVLLAAYLTALLIGAPPIVGMVLSQAALLLGLAVVIIGTRRYRLATYWSWGLVLAMLLVNVGSLFPAGVLAGTASPPGVSDVFYLLSYVVGGIGLIRMVRRRSPAWSVPALIDACIITVSAGLLAWVYLIDPILGVTGVGLPTRLVAAAYPMGDLMLAAFGARILLDGGPKTPAVYLLTGYLTLTVVPDTLNTLDALAGTTRWEVLTPVLWMVSGLVLGAIGLHPSISSLDDLSDVAAPDLGLLRLAMLALASLLAPAALLVQYLRGAPMHIPLICAACGALFLLVTGRLAALVAVQRRMAVTDMLTGLRSRRYFEDALTGRTQRRAAVLLLDVDHFKRVNDTYGHDGGDRVLREVARRLSQAVRPGDLAARYGGEEFAVLLPDATPDDAWTVADRIRGTIGAEPIAVGDETAVTVTVSVGVACLPADVTDPGRLTLLADRMLYRAKESGRNRVAASPVGVA